MDLVPTRPKTATPLPTDTQRRTPAHEPVNGPAAWKLRSACRGMETDIFYPEHGKSNATAKAVCESCTVQDQCLDAALARPERHGIWGGTTERERRDMRANAA